MKARRRYAIRLVGHLVDYSTGHEPPMDLRFSSSKRFRKHATRLLVEQLTRISEACDDGRDALLGLVGSAMLIPQKLRQALEKEDVR